MLRVKISAEIVAVPAIRAVDGRRHVCSWRNLLQQSGRKKYAEFEWESIEFTICQFYIPGVLTTDTIKH